MTTEEEMTMMEKVKAVCEDRGLPYKGEFLDSLSEEELDKGYIKFNIQDEDRIDSEYGEGVWGWVTPEDHEKYNDDSYTGEITAILCNTPLNFCGILWYGSEVVLKCHGSYRPTISPAWIRENIFDAKWYRALREE